MILYYPLPACMMLNDSGDLVPDPECFRSQTAEIPSASPSIQPPTTESRGSTIGVKIVLPILATLIIVVSLCLLVVLMVCIKHRKKEGVVKKSTLFPRYIVVCIITAIMTVVNYPFLVLKARIHYTIIVSYRQKNCGQSIAVVVSIRALISAFRWK